MLPFISFYFLESGLFKGLRPKEIKILLSAATRAASCSHQRFKQPAALVAAPGRRAEARIDFCHKEY